MSDPDPYMSGLDALMWRMEADPRLRGTATTVLLLDRAPDWDRFVDKMDRVSRLTTRMRQKVVETPFRLTTPRWTNDGDFDLDYHLRHASAPPPGDLQAVLDMAATWSETPFDRDRPLWEYTLVEGLEDNRAALVQKIHHSISDGVGGMELALLFFDADRDSATHESMPDAPPAEELDRLSLSTEILRRRAAWATSVVMAVPGATARFAVRALRDPIGTTTETGRLAASTMKMLSPVNDTASPVMIDRSLSRRFHVLEVDLDRLKRGSKALGGSVNDAFVTALSGGLALYHERHDETTDRLRVTMPISIRDEDDAGGGNRITSARFEVPAGKVETSDRLREISQETTAIRNEPGIAATDAVADVMSRLPTALVTGVFGNMLCHIDFLASNVPGFPEFPYLAGARAERWYAFGPTEGAALNVTLLSHGGICCIGINTDPAAIGDPEVLVECLVKGFDDVVSLGDANTTEPPAGAQS